MSDDYCQEDEQHILHLGSLFDGSGGFPLAGVINGIYPSWASEIEPYPMRVTALRFPCMKQLGDIRQIDGAKVEPVDIITFGSPCQNLSIAGKQAGIMNGTRSSLFFEAIRIIKEMRDATAAKFPRWAVWENVRGALTNNHGEDFRAVIEAFCSVRGKNVSVPLPQGGRWTHAGCVVGDGYSLAWRLYDAQYWGVPQRRKRVYLIADFAGERAGEVLFERESVPGNTEASGKAREGAAATAEGCAGGCNTSVTHDITLCVYDARGNGDGKTTNTLTGDHMNRVTDYTALVAARCLSMSEYAIDGTIGTLKARDFKGGAIDVVTVKKPGQRYVVRRLTPLECCRLQGFPDFWEDGAEGSDTARYKMWGNGIALPCAADVLRRIARAAAEDNDRKENVT